MFALSIESMQFSQETHGRICARRCVRSFSGSSGSASSGRAITIRSASPRWRISSASSGEWMRPTAITGTSTAFFTATRAPRLCASPQCEPVTIIEVSRSITPPETWNASTPASTSRGAIRAVSSIVRPPCTRS